MGSKKKKKKKRYTEVPAPVKRAETVPDEIKDNKISESETVSEADSANLIFGKYKDVKAIIASYLFFPLLFIFMELMFHLYYFQEFDESLLYGAVFALAYGIIVRTLTGFVSGKVNRPVAWALTGLICVYFNLQLVYGHIFKTFISLYSVRQNAGDATEFWKEALHGIIESLPGIVLLLIIPMLLVYLAVKRGIICGGAPDGAEFRKKTIIEQLISLAAAVLLYIAAVCSLALNGKDEYSQYDLYHNSWMLDMGIEKLGIMTAARLDVKDMLFGAAEGVELEETAGMSSLVISVPEAEVSPTPVLLPSPTPVPPEHKEEDVPAATPTPTPSPSPTPTPIDTSPNVLDIDFAALAEQESNSDIRGMHEYFATAEPTKKNEYTGMFEGYNLIFLTAEGFSPWAVDEKVTPTLYKLTHEGFVFNNFYTPIWYTSTSDGEYVACTGLIPYSTNSFKRSKNNSLPFCMGWQFLKLGYTSRAWHAHTATYYGREYTHPNMGYIFKAKNAGLPITNVWPESDYEMLQLTVPEYINDEKFHVYYMTVSGHLEYNFSGNVQAKKNKSYVEELPYSDAVKAYIACNKELDLALEYLLAELEKAGIADKTVIAMSADHYPYGLTDEQINEVAGHVVDKEFELYKNNFVLWSASIKEPIVIDKYCSSLDIIPTLSNLFGLEYDSRLLMGSDILSDSPALVMFSDKSFITDYCMYSTGSGKVTMLQDIELPEDYIKSVSKIVRNKFNISKNVLLLDYYKYIDEFIPNRVTEVPEGY